MYPNTRSPRSKRRVMAYAMGLDDDFRFGWSAAGWSGEPVARRYRSGQANGRAASV